MPYIGVAPSAGLFKKLDSITTVNAQAAYTMQHNSSNFAPATAEQQTPTRWSHRREPCHT